MSQPERRVVIGVLALQGAFSEHIQLLSQAFASLNAQNNNAIAWSSVEVRSSQDLGNCDALIIPGGESTAIALVAARSGLLEPLRQFVKVARKPTWGTCAGLILLAEAANKTKKGGQELIGGLDVRVNRNHFGRQVESFEAELTLPFLDSSLEQYLNEDIRPFRGVFIRAPIVEKLLPHREGEQEEEGAKPNTVLAPSRTPKPSTVFGSSDDPVEVMATLPGRSAALSNGSSDIVGTEVGDIIAVKQRNVFGTSFHPELSGDPRVHLWWLIQLKNAIETAG